MGGRGGGSGISHGGGGGGGGGGPDDDARFTRQGLGPKYKNALQERFKLGTKVAKEIYDMLIPAGGAVIDPNHNDTAYYSAADNKIRMNFLRDLRDDRGPGTVWFHEHGHFIDYNIGRILGFNLSDDRAFQQALRKDVEDYEYNFAMNPPAWFRNLRNSGRVISFTRGVAMELTQWTVIDKTNAIQDIFGGIHRDRTYYHWGHDNNYWLSDRTVAIEAAAHMFEAQFGQEKAGYMQRYLPTAWKRYNDLLRDATEELKRRRNRWR